MNLKKYFHKVLDFFELDFFLTKRFPRASIKFIKENLGKDLRGVEIGVFRGEHAYSILKTLPILRIWLIDPYIKYEGYEEGDKRSDSFFVRTEKEMENRLEEFRGKFVFIKRTSKDAVPLIEGKLDFVYIDGNHKYEYINSDIKEYFKKLRVGGVLCGDNVDYPEVIKAVSEFSNENKLSLNIKDNDWWMVKE